MKQIVCNDLADKVFSTPSPAMKAQDESLGWVRITKMTTNGPDDRVADEVLTMQQSGKVVFQT